MSVGKRIKGVFRFAAAALVSIIRAPISFALSVPTVALSALGQVLRSIREGICSTLGNGLVIKAIFLPLFAAEFIVRGVGCCLDFVNYRVCNEFLAPIAGKSIPLAYTYDAICKLERGTFFARKFYCDRIKNFCKLDTWYAKGLFEVCKGEDYNLEAYADMLHSKREEKPDIEHEGHDYGSDMFPEEYRAMKGDFGRRYASDNLRNQRPGSDGPPEAQKDSERGPGRQ